MKKSMKRVGILVLIAAIIFAVLPVTSAFAAGFTVSTLTKGTIMNAGDTILNDTSETIQFSGNAALILNYDSIPANESYTLPDASAKYKVNVTYSGGDVLSLDPTYRITVEAAQGGTASADQTDVFSGTRVNLTATPDEGYQFKEWVVEQGVVTIAGNGFTFYGGGNVKIKAVFEEAAPGPTATPTAEPTATPTAEPTATPTAEPTAAPTADSNKDDVPKTGDATTDSIMMILIILAGCGTLGAIAAKKALSK